jgi:UDP-N-acetylmuramoyl-tripeptide--D-alanyl-D-alanine ligase
MTNIDSLYTCFLQNPIISTDTRSILPGSLFFALKGDKFDANSFAQQALEQGAAYAIIDDSKYALGEEYILVDDVLSTLQALARHHRQQLNIPVIGLTGSNGKTTTKELIHAVLSQKYNSYATVGNLNNHIGVPLTILSIHADVEVAIVEMGANHQKEIELLCSIAQPTHGLITNVGMAHLEGFGGFEGVKKGKAELYAHLKKQDGTTFIYKDNAYLMEMSAKAALDKVVYYGTGKENEVSGRLLQADPFLQVSWRLDDVDYTAKTNLTGSYNFENILGAICIGHYFGLTPEEINAGLAGYLPKNNRSQLTETAANRVICDFYNANPSSMAAALNNLSSLSAAHKMAIIGDMFELGPESAAQHKLIAAHASAASLDQVIFIGKEFYAYKDQFRGTFFLSPQEAQAYLEKHPVKDHLILLKGSRGMALEQLLPLL